MSFIFCGKGAIIISEYSSLYRRTNYTIDCTHVLNTTIYEYDMKSAGMNILYSIGVIDDRSYNYLSALPKSERNIQIGYMQKNDKTIKQKLSDGFREYRRIFFESNSIKDEDIISIKKDAIFLIRPVLNTKFDSVVFEIKNTYTSLFKTNFLELFFDSTHNIIDIKGINDKKLIESDMYKYHKRHFDFMLNKLKYLFKLKETNPDMASREFLNFAVEYKNLRLDVEYYRMLCSNPVFVTDIKSIMGCITMKEYDPSFNLDISYNYNYIIRPIGNIMLE